MGIKVLFVIFALCFNSFHRVLGDANSSPVQTITEQSEEIAYQKLLKMEKGMKDSIKKLVDQALPMLMNSNSSVDLSGPCMGSVLKMIGALKKMRLWPFEMIDAIGKPPGGIFSGTSSALGSYQQCINIVIPTFNKKRKPNVGQYCIIELSPLLPPKPYRNKVGGNVFPHINATFETELMKMTRDTLSLFYLVKFNWGICLPSTCTIDDLNQILAPLTSQMGLEANVKSCEIKEPLKMDVLQIVIVSALCVFVVVNILSTILYEIQLYRSGGNETKLLEGYWFTATSYFSMRKNFVTLMRTTEATPGSLDAINGIKVITMTWIVLCHAYVNNDSALSRELSRLKDFFKDIYFQVVINGYLSVSTFFLLTGVLMAYNIVKRHDAGKPINPFILFFRRCYRIAPVMFLTIGFTLLKPLLTSGPLYKGKTTELANVCRENWWKNALFINNFYSMENMCEPPTWYLAVDIQCAIFGLLYLFILFKNKATAKLFLLLATIGSSAGIAYVTYVKDYPPSYLATFLDKEFAFEFWRTLYMSPYLYYGVYSVGLFLGTYLARASKIQINKLMAAISWIVSFAVGLTIVYAVHPWNSGDPYTMLESISYASLHRLGWGIALGWVILACFSGRGGVINDFLSWPGFQPLVRLSYIVYLMNSLVYTVYVFSLQGPQDITHTTTVFNFLACLCVSHIMAVFIRVMYEYPLLKIENDFYKWLEQRKSSKPKGLAMSAEIRNEVALSLKKKRDDVELNKVIVNGIQFTKENGTQYPKNGTDTQLTVEVEEETKLEVNQNVTQILENVSFDNSTNETNERNNKELEETEKETAH